MSSTDAVRRLLDLAEAALAEPSVSAEEVARRSSLSRFHFDRLVGAAAGEPPGALRRRILLERAAHRVVGSEWTVLDVAVEAGYGSHEAFTRAFTRAYGVSPTALRRRPKPAPRELDLPTTGGVHFQPPAGLRLAATRKESDMSVLLGLVDHHVRSLSDLLRASEPLGSEVLDAPIEMSIEGVDEDMTLRRVLNTMVTQEEHWVSALHGGAWPDESDTTVAGLRARHERAGADFRAFAARAIEAQSLGDTLVDTTCEPPTTFTTGGVIGHVITFAAVRRTIAVGALWSAGIERMDLADPRDFVDAALVAAPE